MGLVFNQEESLTKMVQSLKEEIDEIISVTLTSKGFKFKINPNYIRMKCKEYKLIHPTDGRTVMALTDLIDNILNGDCDEEKIEEKISKSND